MWGNDWTITPQGKAYQDLVYNKWWTKTSGKTEDNGIFTTRGFYGDYEITAEGKIKKVSLSRKKQSVEVVF